MRIAREGWPLAAVLLIPVPAVGWLLHPWAAAPLLLAGLFTLWFFRDPERTTPREPGVLISPADGRVIQAGPERLSIFMNVFNVHVCRSPLSGVVEEVKHVPGRFFSAFKDAASEHNERTTIVIADGERQLRFTLVAGLIARRIVCSLAGGQRVRAGQRIGLIRFGSRVDVDLPAWGECDVRVGEHVVAGETVISRAVRRPGRVGAVGHDGSETPEGSGALVG